MKIFIKHMVSNSCKMFVKEELNKLGIHYTSIDLGEININENLSMFQLESLESSLNKYGLELIVDTRVDTRYMLLEKIKRTIIEMVNYTEDRISTKYSCFLSEKLNRNYTYLSGIFSDGLGITIEKYIILLKIERIKELMMYDELNLTEIAWKLNYSSVAHLSGQFKKVTGLTPSQFKHLGSNRRMPIDEVGITKNIYHLSRA